MARQAGQKNFIYLTKNKEETQEANLRDEIFIWRGGEKFFFFFLRVKLCFGRNSILMPSVKRVKCLTGGL